MVPLDPIQAIIGLGVSGVLAVGIWALATGRVRVGSLVEADKAAEAIRLKEVKDERDSWKALAQAATIEFKRYNDLLDSAIKLLSDRAP